MLQSRPTMFCPHCHAEYLPHVRRCSDCDVLLVEHLPVTRDDSGIEAVSGVAVLKELGPIIAIPFVAVALLILIVALGKNPYRFQIVTLLGYTYFVFLLVFCDTRGWKGYSLGEEAVRQKLPLLLCIHAGFLVVIFAGVTVAILVHPHLSLFWTLERGRGGSGRFSNLSYFDFISVLIGVAILFTQVFISRGILGRALKGKQRSGGS
jgi:hypothetical protein